MDSPTRSPDPARILTQGLRGAVFLRIDIADTEGSFAQLIGLIAASIALKFAMDYYSVGPHGEFAFYGLPSLLFKVPLILVAAWTLSSLGGKPDATLKLAVVISAIAISISISGEMLLWILSSRPFRHYLQSPGIYYPLHVHLVPAWLALAAAVAGIRLLDLPRRRMGLAVLSGVLLIWIPLAQIGPYQTIWTSPYDPEEMNREEAQRNALTEERAFYAQSRLLEHALTSLTPSQPDRTNLYFVGVAGDSGQDVFMKEIRYVSNFFKARFGTSGRSITLINNPKTVMEAPAASVTSLRLALNRIGEVMDTEKDILFLYLTSHGSKEHRFSLDFGSIRFEVLDPAVLRKLLDDSGIKRRVVVVSSCYSGGFVKPLEDANTLVITASAPDKTSYGCSNEADFTFFGKAYFEDGLRKTDSFVEAFNIAQPLISVREARDGYEPAQPMISIGTEIRDALDQYAEQERHALQRSSAARVETNSTVQPNQSQQRCSSCP